MARRKAIPLLAVAGVAVVGVLAYGTLSEKPGQLNEKSLIDPGGGPVLQTPAPEAPYGISTLSPVGTAAQDPGGGGGGNGARPGVKGPPGIIGPLGPGSAQSFQALGPTLYLSGENLLDPNRSATTSGQTPVGAGGFQTDGSVTGCASGQAADYYAIPIRRTTTFSGSPRVHLRVSGGGTVTVTLFEQDQLGSQQCRAITSGSGTIRGGVADFSLGGTSHNFKIGSTPGIVVSTGSSGTINTDSNNPSFLTLPNLTGV